MEVGNLLPWTCEGSPITNKRDQGRFLLREDDIVAGVKESASIVGHHRCHLSRNQPRCADILEIVPLVGLVKESIGQL